MMILLQLRLLLSRLIQLLTGSLLFLLLLFFLRLLLLLLLLLLTLSGLGLPDAAELI
jgi:hypothetical protein